MQCQRNPSDYCVLPDPTRRKPHNCSVCRTVEQWVELPGSKVVVAEIPHDRFLLRACPETECALGALMEFRLSKAGTDELRRTIQAVIESADEVWSEFVPSQSVPSQSVPSQSLPRAREPEEKGPEGLCERLK